MFSRTRKATYNLIQQQQPTTVILRTASIFTQEHNMKFTSLLLALLCSATALADRPIILVTPQGVWMAEVKNGIPGPFTSQNFDVIVQGFSTTPIPIPDPRPPVEDPIVKQIAELSAAPTLKDKTEATAVAAVVNSLSKVGLSGNDFKEALEMAAPIVDASLSSNGRIVSWVKRALTITAIPDKLKAGLKQAWNIDDSTLGLIDIAAESPKDAAVPEEALEWVQIIQIIQMIIQLLQNLGIIK